MSVEHVNDAEKINTSVSIVRQGTASLCLLIKYCDMNAWGSGGIYPLFFTSAPDGGEWPVSRPGRSVPGERAFGTDLIGGWMSPIASLDAREKRNILLVPGI
jgi:hypothetical protein